ncbi:peptidylprolyl isomerase [Sediminibacterium roseum]|uniref:peptidylprolyl isomerase n=1 Tax=Sediminibacterium roseum TaxID=1978412 RepID=A0ABW9ZQN7_9BACT|nr:peptidylprolyl isomerase [Sediminibacterium roseum]NCI48358.1 peptidylprolyl isomerase [Sediminibacterium roseum]
MKKGLLLVSIFVFYTATAQVPSPAVLQQKAPETFRAVFKTTKGEFVIEANRKWSPLGVDRLYQLISSGFYNNNLLFRVEPGFVTQFGIAPDRATNRFWDPKKIKDEPRLHKNTKGTLAFARGGKNDRCTQLFINNTDNPKLDTETRLGVTGYTPVARIIKGIGVLSKFNARYGKKPALVQDSLYKYGNFYFEERFAGLDKVISAKIIN